MKKVGDKIRKIRELKGYSQENMADMLEMSQRNYARFESNDADIKLSSLGRISQILEVSMEQILGFDEKILFQNCRNAYGAINQTNYNYPMEEILKKLNFLEERISQLESKK